MAVVPEINLSLPKLLLMSGEERLRSLLAEVRGHRVLKYRMAGQTFYFVTDPELTRYVLQENQRNYVKSRSYEELRHFLGDGLLTSEGDFWRRQRRLAQPAFHHRALAGLVDTMADAGREMLERWERLPTPSIDALPEMMRVTLTVVGRTLLGADLSAAANDVTEALTFLLADADRRMLLPPLRVPRALPTPGNRRFRHHRETLDRYVYDIIRARRQAGENAPRDLLSMLLAARDPDSGEGMTDTQLRDELMTLVLAGHETTANALAWAFVLLSRHPVARRRLEAEVDEVLGDRAPTLEDLPRLTYTSWVVHETLRIYPPAWLFERQAVAADRLGPYEIPAGAAVTLAPYVLHHDPAWWDNPAGFDPERFSPERSEGRPKFAFLPFGGGPRVCIGNQFALMEAQILLAMVTRRFRLDLDPTHPIDPNPLVTMRPRHGVRVALVPRREAALRATGS